MLNRSSILALFSVLFLFDFGNKSLFRNGRIASRPAAPPIQPLAYYSYMSMAFTTTMLSWSVIEFGGLMKGELQNAREAIRWATDYLLKATAHPDTIYIQVGDAGKYHACWERPEDMDTPRSVLKIDKNTPGTEVAAETAAALAAASLVFRKSDPNYSKILARRAMGV